MRVEATLSSSGVVERLALSDTTLRTKACGNTKGYSSTALAMGFANVRAGTRVRLSQGGLDGHEVAVQARPVELARARAPDDVRTERHAADDRGEVRAQARGGRQRRSVEQGVGREAVRDQVVACGKVHAERAVLNAHRVLAARRRRR